MLEGAGFPKGGNAVVLGGATIAGYFRVFRVVARHPGSDTLHVN